MKKLLLFASLSLAFGVQAQDFWTPKATTFATASRGLNDLFIVNASVVWAKAYDGASTAVNPPNIREYTKSADGGNTWTSGTIALGTGNSLLNVSSICAVSATTAWVTAYPSAASAKGGIWKTTNGGTTWAKQTTALYNTADSFTNLAYFWNANDGIVQGDPSDGYFEIYTTTDGGTTWTRVPSASIPTSLTEEYGYVKMYDVVGDTIWFGTSKGRIFKSTDKGLTWTVAQTPIADLGGETVSGNFTFSDASKGLLVTQAGVIYKTTDGGTTWTSFTPTGTVGAFDIEYVPGTSTAVSIGADALDTPFTSYSFNDGLTWTTTMSGTQVVGAYFLNSTVGFAGGFNTDAATGGVFKYTGTVLATDHFNQKAKLAVYPNPAGDVINVSAENISNITVFDILGKQVLTKNFSAVNDLTLDVSTLNSGIYIMTATDNSGATQNVKFSKK